MLFFPFSWVDFLSPDLLLNPYAPIWRRYFGVYNPYSFTRITQSKPQAQPQANLRLTCLGFFSMLRTSSPCIEPGELPLLMEAMPYTDIFLGQEWPWKNRLLRSDPQSAGQRVVGLFQDRCLETDPDYPRSTCPSSTSFQKARCPRCMPAACNLR